MKLTPNGTSITSPQHKHKKIGKKVIRKLFFMVRGGRDVNSIITQRFQGISQKSSLSKYSDLHETISRKPISSPATLGDGLIIARWLLI